MADRQDLLRNALAFLADPSTRHHPIAQRISFLESKGLTSAEIEQVLQQSASSSASVPPAPTYGATTQYAPSQYPLSVIQPAPAIPQRDWRDYFIMAVVSGGVMFGVMSLARKYLLPHLQPPSVTAYEADRDELTAQFDAAAALVKDIQDETKASRAIIDEQRAKVDIALEKLDAAITETKEAEVRSRTELREIRDEVNNVRDMLPKMIEKNKDAQSQALVDLQQELKSLKTLLLSRGPSIGDYGSPLSSPGGVSIRPRPSIPAWQLAPATVPITPVIPPAIVDKGKGKEESSSDAMASSTVLVDHEKSESEDEIVA